MSSEPPDGPRTRPGTRPLIVGVVLSATGVISIAALVVQLAAYDPSCEPLLVSSFSGPCGALRILVVLMLPFLVLGIILVALGLARRWRGRPGPTAESPGAAGSGASASNEREPRQKPRR